MDNGHRLRLDDDTLRRVLGASGVDPLTATGWAELTEGTYNTAYRIRLADGSGLLLKVAPSPDAPGLTYERDLMRTETAFYRAAGGHAVVPEVVHADFSRTTVAADLLLMTEIPGGNLAARGATTTPGERSALRTDLGRVVAGLHQVTGTGFGYPQLGLARTWREGFLSMVDALLADAGRFAVPLPADDVAGLMRSHAALLDEVSRPVLVHFDLWDGNVMVDAGRVSGLIDGERAFWGDPLAEFVSLALFDDVERDPALLSGYGAVEFTREARLRLAMYRSYLYLIMLIEGTPRRYSGPGHQHQVQLVLKHLNAELAMLRAAGAA
ncbi:phosphotransferase family protein [Lentzea sp. NPDC058436]|uniref:phosphotransferase family protein n=1 Tax=Lentzea sp. NPDC058436 TaxID=3346499 RepID=UPI003647052E